MSQLLLLTHLQTSRLISSDHTQNRSIATGKRPRLHRALWGSSLPDTFHAALPSWLKSVYEEHFNFKAVFVSKLWGPPQPTSPHRLQK
jgi:hypothetical protein